MLQKPQHVARLHCLGEDSAAAESRQRAMSGGMGLTISDEAASCLPAIKDGLVIVGLKADSSEAAIRLLSERLLRWGYVTSEFADATVERELTFPTGIPAQIPVAIPHCDACYSRKSAIAFGRLEQPVRFGEMGALGRTIEVELVFLLALHDPESQVHWLKKLADFFQEREPLAGLLSLGSEHEVARYLRRHIIGDGRGGE